eukprot:3987591-Prymnesium_polylepis.1
MPPSGARVQAAQPRGKPRVGQATCGVGGMCRVEACVAHAKPAPQHRLAVEFVKHCLQEETRPSAAQEEAVAGTWQARVRACDVCVHLRLTIVCMRLRAPACACVCLSRVALAFGRGRRSVWPRSIWPRRAPVERLQPADHLEAVVKVALPRRVAVGRPVQEATQQRRRRLHAGAVGVRACVPGHRDRHHQVPRQCPRRLRLARGRDDRRRQVAKVGVVERGDDLVLDAEEVDANALEQRRLGRPLDLVPPVVGPVAQQDCLPVHPAPRVPCRLRLLQAHLSQTRRALEPLAG